MELYTVPKKTEVEFTKQIKHTTDAQEQLFTYCSILENGLFYTYTICKAMYM